MHCITKLNLGQRTFKLQQNVRTKFAESTREKLKKKKVEHKENFQQWAEFQERGFKIPEYMQSWFIDQYGAPEKVLKKEAINLPQHKMVTGIDARKTYLLQQVRQPNDVLVKVHAASLNPIDIRMCQGYGEQLFNFQRNFLFKFFDHFPTKAEFLKDYEFPLVMGRDFSGTVIDVGTGVYDLEPGDEVYGAPALYNQGTLSDYIAVDLAYVVQKPATCSHIDAASIPYVALTVVSTLKEALSIREKCNRALVLGGSGGIGTFAIQYLRANGFSVTTTCSSAGQKICSSLGAECINYHTENVDEVVSKQDKYGIVFDIIGAATPAWAKPLLISGGTYATLQNNLVERTNRYGVIAGLGASMSQMIADRSRNYGINVKWGIYQPDRNSLLEIARYIDSGNIKPIVDAKNIYPFDDVPKAFKKLGEGHTKGKIVVNVSGQPEATQKPPVDKIIHL
uniref:Reticulon-4-interacting protein 1 homolog, mitochondrial-like n=1 Tax=Phallusia mammillata TaxID=59560 RepID=A0A6F9DS47_9ASCI|nr:reticulon-4-interacting protein 1 homolog, mitochondrial-like [Phallusia mammillata]